MQYPKTNNGERAKAFMSHYLKAIERSLSMVQEEVNVPDFQGIFGMELKSLACA